MQCVDTEPVDDSEISKKISKIYSVEFLLTEMGPFPFLKVVFLAVKCLFLCVKKEKKKKKFNFHYSKIR